MHPQLNRVIAFESGIPNSVAYDSDTDRLLYIVDSCPVLTNLNDPFANQFFFRGHQTPLNILKASQNFNLAASAEIHPEQPDIFVWDLNTRTLKHRLEDHVYGVSCMAFSHDERFLCTIGANEDGKIIIWDMQTGQLVAMEKFFATNVEWGGRRKDIKGRPTTDFVFATSGAGKIHLWSLSPNTGELHKKEITSGASRREYTCLKFSRDEALLFAGTTSGDFEIFSALKHNMITSQNGIRCGIQCMEVLENKDLILGSGDGRISVFSLHDPEDDHRILYVEQGMSDILSGPISNICISKDGLEFIVSTRKGLLYRMRASTFDYIIVWESPFGNLLDVAFDPSSSCFTTCGEDCTVRLWSAEDYNILCKNSMDRVIGTCAAMTSLYIIIGGDDGHIHSFDREQCEPTWIIRNAHKTKLTALAVSPNERFLVSGSTDGSMRIHDTHSQQLLHHQRDHLSAITKLKLLDDRYCLSASRDKTWCCWDLLNNKRVCSYQQCQGAINDICVSINDLKNVVTTGQEKSLTWWDMRAGQVACIPSGSIYNTLDKTKDDQYLIAGGEDGYLHLWDLRQRRIMDTYTGHTNAINKACFNSDETKIISIGKDKAICAWDIVGKKLEDPLMTALEN